MDGQVRELGPIEAFKRGARKIEAERLEKKNGKVAKEIGDIVFDEGITSDEGKDEGGNDLEKRLTFKLSTGEKMDLCLKRKEAFILSDRVEDVRWDFDELLIEVISKDGQSSHLVSMGMDGKLKSHKQIVKGKVDKRDPIVFKSVEEYDGLGWLAKSVVNDKAALLLKRAQKALKKRVSK